MSPPVRYNTCSQVVSRLQNGHKTTKCKLARCETSKTWTLARREHHARGMSRFPSLTDERKTKKKTKTRCFAVCVGLVAFFVDQRFCAQAVSLSHTNLLSSSVRMYIFRTLLHIRELKERRRRRQRQRRKTIGLMSKNNRPALAFYILVHFFAVICKTTT